MRVTSPRRVFAFAALSLALLFNLSCGGSGSDGGPPEPASVVVTPGVDTVLSLNESRLYTAQVLDADGAPVEGTTVTWSSSDTTIVHVVAATGLITSRGNGSAEITATVGDLEGSAPVTVTQVPVTITITPPVVNFTFVGDTQTFTATVLDSGGAPVVPVQKIWSINDNSVAVIDSIGRARAKGAGTAMVTMVAIGPGGAKAGFAAVQSTQPVASIVIRNQPTAVIAGEALDPAIQVEVRDSGGGVVTSYGGAITIGIDSGPNGSVVRGTKTVNAVSGVASFSGLSLERAGAVRLRATATALAPAATTPITVTAASPHQMHIIQNPGFAIAGAPIPLIARGEDRFGNPTTVPISAALELIDGPAGEELVGPTGGTFALNGTITFDSTHLEQAIVGYVVRVTSPGLLPDTSGSFGVAPAAPYRIRLIGDSGLRVGTPVGAPVMSIRIVDPFENIAPSAQFAVLLTPVWSFAAPVGRGQRVVPTDTQFVTGQADLTTAYYMRPGSTTLIASAPGLIADTGEAWDPHFSFASVAYVGLDVICFDARYCAGANDHGQLGVDPGALLEDSVFIDIDSIMDDFGPLVIGTTAVCAIDYILPGSIPTVMCRGDNDEGQLGQGTTGSGGAQFLRIPGATGWWSVALGEAHACALTVDSTAACWGRNDHGQLGRGTTTPNEPTPAAVSGGTKFKQIAAGGDQTCGVTTSNTILCWGANGSGQLGDSSTTDRSAPAAVVGGYTWAEVAVGAAFACGIKTNAGRKALCWGDNSVAQLGDVGAGGGRIYPGLVSGGLNDLPFGLVAGIAHSCMLGNSALVCWGDDSQGQIGNGPTNVPVHSPYGISIPGAGGLVSYSVGGYNSCLVRFREADFPHTQQLFCWGSNDRGQLGTGNSLAQSSPAQVLQ